jgi:hypothetical protein
MSLLLSTTQPYMQEQFYQQRLLIATSYIIDVFISMSFVATLTPFSEQTLFEKNVEQIAPYYSDERYSQNKITRRFFALFVMLIVKATPFIASNDQTPSSHILQHNMKELM